AERVSIFRKKEERNYLEFYIFSKGEDELKKIKIGLSKGIVGWVYKNNKPLIVNDVSKSKMFYKTVDKITGFKTNSILAFPLRLKKRKYGVIEIINKKKGGFTKKDLKICELISPFIAITLENATLFEKIEEMFFGMIRSFAKAVEAKDPYTSGHVERVENLSYLLAKKVGLKGKELKNARIAGILHDIGKIGIPDEILKKPEKLTKEEYEIIKKHVLYAKEILEPIGEMKDIIPAIYYHHERYDGKGYPEGKKGEEIPLLARIISIVDAFDAMASDRPYRKALSAQEILREFLKNKGKQFDPYLVDNFLSLKEVQDILGTL
ncbi:MAG: HD domain-containing phosphohydrolase, partial [candidate division WOR-3 bacterium]